ncbi:MAG: ribosome silencing factor [Candidatus Omnitrophica bacterium]|nr:ribosome silencing factor [Candidatus Omnitrophota bacterium]
MVRLRSPLALSKVEAPKKLALRIAALARAKKAQGLIILDMQKASNFCDYFVILSGTSLRQVNAIAKDIQEDLEKDRIKSLSKVSPTDESGWVVLDYISVVVHIFYKPMREFYSLERLWSDAKKVRIPPFPASL